MHRLCARLLPASLAAVAVALLALPVAVSAAPPAVETFHDEGSSAVAGVTQSSRG